MFLKYLMDTGWRGHYARIWWDRIVRLGRLIRFPFDVIRLRRETGWWKSFAKTAWNQIKYPNPAAYQ